MNTNLIGIVSAFALGGSLVMLMNLSNNVEYEEKKKTATLVAIVAGGGLAYAFYKSFKTN